MLWRNRNIIVGSLWDDSLEDKLRGCGMSHIDVVEGRPQKAKTQSHGRYQLYELGCCGSYNVVSRERMSQSDAGLLSRSHSESRARKVHGCSIRETRNLRPAFASHCREFAMAKVNHNVDVAPTSSICAHLGAFQVSRTRVSRASFPFVIYDAGEGD
nr:hypothetical protein CFP56_16594 [Quercus suber]